MKAEHVGFYRAISHGNRGLVMTIPAPFVRANNLYPGSLLSICRVEDEQTILIIQIPGDSIENIPEE